MYRMTVKAWASILLCALFFAAAAAKPAYASESGDAVQQIPAAQDHCHRLRLGRLGRRHYDREQGRVYADGHFHA